MVLVLFHLLLRMILFSLSKDKGTEYLIVFHFLEQYLFLFVGNIKNLNKDIHVVLSLM